LCVDEDLAHGPIFLDCDSQSLAEVILKRPEFLVILVADRGDD
jgi:hypothetical protein